MIGLLKSMPLHAYATTFRLVSWMAGYEFLIKETIHSLDR